jgi:hypothetical protein
MAETPAKTRKSEERNRMTHRGFKRFEAWVHRDDEVQVRAYVDALSDARGHEPLPPVKFNGTKKKKRSRK